MLMSVGVPPSRLQQVGDGGLIVDAFDTGSMGGFRPRRYFDAAHAVGAAGVDDGGTATLSHGLTRWRG
jgi:hypothetical protein